MAHQTARSGYAQLVKRLNRHPQGAPPSEVLFKILKQAMASRQMKSRYLDRMIAALKI